MIKSCIPGACADSELAPATRRLLEQLQGGNGSDIGVPSVYPGTGGFEAHARAYFSNAARLCEKPDAHDFCIFGALYGIRHGLELWLKGLLIEKMIDDALGLILAGAESVDAVGKGLNLNKMQKNNLLHSLCIMRNCCEDDLVHPECIEKNIDETSAERAILFIKNGHLERYKLACVWTVGIPGHSLQELWGEARERLEDLSLAALYHPELTGCDAPMSVEKVESVCELIHHWDPGGETFRYPLTLGGRWGLELPSLNLKALGQLAGELQVTCLSYENLLQEGY